MLNQDQLLSALRWVLAAGGGYAVGHGWLDSEQAALIGGGLVAMVPFVWGLWTHAQAQKIATATALPTQDKLAIVAAIPNVQTVVTTDQKTADAAPSSKVVSAVDAAMTANASLKP